MDFLSVGQTREKPFKTEQENDQEIKCFWSYLYSFKNLESFRDQMHKLDVIFKMMSEAHKE